LVIGSESFLTQRRNGAMLSETTILNFLCAVAPLREKFRGIIAALSL
jgi:hypothetical protein